MMASLYLPKWIHLFYFDGSNLIPARVAWVYINKRVLLTKNRDEDRRFLRAESVSMITFKILRIIPMKGIITTKIWTDIFNVCNKTLWLKETTNPTMLFYLLLEGKCGDLWFDFQYGLAGMQISPWQPAWKNSIVGYLKWDVWIWLCWDVSWLDWQEKQRNWRYLILGSRLAREPVWKAAKSPLVVVL